MRKALLVVDMQEEFFGENRDREKFKYDQVLDEDIYIKEFVQRINKHIERTNRDGNLVIYIQQQFPNELFYRKVFNFAIKGTEGVKVLKDITIVSELFFTKIFGSAFTNRKLKTFLKENGIKEIEIVGVDATKCAFYTAKSSAKAGYKTYMIMEAIDSRFPKEVEKCEKKLKSLGVEYI